MPAAPAEHPKRRFSSPNNPQRSKAAVLIPKLDTVSQTNQKGKASSPLRIFSILDVLMAADHSEEFWKLDACGRIRALVTIVQSSSNIKLEILPAQFIKASVDEIDWHFGLEEEQQEHLESHEDRLSREGPLYTRTLKEWGLTGVPSILVHDPLIGAAIVETSAWSALENTDYLFLRYGDGLVGTSYGIASHVWDAQDPPARPVNGGLPDHYIYTTFITRGLMTRKGFTLHTCEQSVDPKFTRSAIRQILETIRDAHSVENKD